jgi:hypothetical protein
LIEHDLIAKIITWKVENPSQNARLLLMIGVDGLKEWKKREKHAGTDMSWHLALMERVPIEDQHVFRDDRA